MGRKNVERKLTWEKSAETLEKVLRRLVEIDNPSYILIS